MKERVITGIVLVLGLILVGIIDNKFVIGLLIAIISILGMFEAKNLFSIKDERIFYFLSAMSIVSIFINPILVSVLAILIVASYIAYFQKEVNLISIAFYPFLPLMLLFSLYLKTSIALIGWLILIVALTDSMAYFIGKNFAKKFFNQGFCSTSPNKSWEGVIGGVVSATIISSIVGLYFFYFLESLLISITISVASVFGDLFESYLKRRAGVKDSGNLLPGHGGILDRIDGYLFAAPLLWAIVEVIK